MRNYHGNHLSRGTHTPPPKNELYIKLLLENCGVFFCILFFMKINRSKWRKGYEGVWKQGEEEGNGFLLYLETLENDDPSSRSPTVLHRGTHRQHTIHLPLTTAVTPIGHMSASFSHVTPRPKRTHARPDLLSLNVSARHRHVLREKTLTIPNLLPFPL